MSQMEQQKLIEQFKAEAYKAEPEERVERIASALIPVIKAAILTFAILFLFKLL
jgi:hypothetical protein